MDYGADCYRRFLAGDDDGLAALIDSYNKGLTYYLLTFVGDLSLADELSEDTFVKLGVKKPQYRGKSSFKTWLYAIGRNTALDYLRRERIKSLPLEDYTELPDDFSVESELLRGERARLLHRAMQTLRPAYRQILWLIYFENMSLRDCAAVMRLSVHSAECLASRARKSLANELNRKGYFDENH